MSTISDAEKHVGDNVASVGSDSESNALPPIDRALEKRLVWKTDLIIMPALGQWNAT